MVMVIVGEFSGDSFADWIRAPVDMTELTKSVHLNTNWPIDHLVAQELTRTLVRLFASSPVQLLIVLGHI